MTNERPLQLVVVQANGHRDLVAHRAFRLRYAGGWWLDVRLASYARAPLIINLDLSRAEPMEEWYLLPGPRLAILGGLDDELFVEIVDHEKTDGETRPTVVATGDPGEDQLLSGTKLVATVGDGYDVALSFEPGPTGNPRIRIKEPAPRWRDREKKGAALAPTCRLNSPFQAIIDFGEYELTSAG